MCIIYCLKKGKILLVTTGGEVCDVRNVQPLRRFKTFHVVYDFLENVLKNNNTLLKKKSSKACTFIFYFYFFCHKYISKTFDQQIPNLICITLLPNVSASLICLSAFCHIFSELSSQKLLVSAAPLQTLMLPFQTEFTHQLVEKRAIKSLNFRYC